MGEAASIFQTISYNLMLSSLQLVDDLRRELEYLQLFKMEMEHPGTGKSLSEYNAKTREIEMEHEVRRLKQVHRHSHTSVGLCCFDCLFNSNEGIHRSCSEPEPNIIIKAKLGLL